MQRDLRARQPPGHAQARDADPCAHVHDIERARSATRCRFHADAYIANNKRDTPPAITDAYLIWGAKGLTDRVLDNNLIVILDAAGNDTGRRVRWQRRKKSKGRDVA